GFNTVNVEGIVGPLTVNLGSGIGIVNITPSSQNLNNVSFPVSVNGRSDLPGAFSELNINDQAFFSLQSVYTLTSSTVTRSDPRSSTQPITFQGINQTHVNTGASFNTFNLQNGASGYTINAGAGVNAGVNVYNVQPSAFNDTINGSGTISDTLN